MREKKWKQKNQQQLTEQSKICKSISGSLTYAYLEFLKKKENRTK